MTKFFLYFALLVTAVSMIAADIDEGPLALLVVSAMCAGIIAALRRYENKDFLTNVFLAALAGRLLFGLLVHVYGLRDFVGPDSITYHDVGSRISDYWMGLTEMSPELKELLSIRGPGWGMNYLIGFIYLLLGQKILVAQSICAVVGAAAAPMAYFCTRSIFHNKRAAFWAAILVALFPAMIVWSGQLLKDGLIAFLLLVCITLAVKLQEKFSWFAGASLIAALLAILSLRFYTFYVISVAVVGAFIIGVNTDFTSLIRRLGVLTVLSVGLIYFGVIKIASVDLENYGSLERIQYSRSAMAHEQSGYGSDIDVSTTGGALSAIPVGFAYLMFAPFPWEMKNLRQSLTLPDVLLWWAMLPLLVYGMWFSVRHKLRPNIPVFVFCFILTLAYSMFQGNLGAAYRQRTQIQIFFFIFIAVGWSVLMEKREDRKRLEQQKIKEMVQRQKAIRERLQQKV
jgi:hypothetical protein